MKTAVCPGTFDPVTLGHVDIIERGLKVFDRIIVAVSKDSPKDTLFSAQERVHLVQSTFEGRSEIEVKTFSGLLVNCAKDLGVSTVLRGLRTFSDFEFEFQMAAANRFMWKEIDTHFMITDGRFSHLSSGLIREIVRYGGDVTGMVPPIVKEQIKKKLN